MTVDPLAKHWGHVVTVRRLTGEGSYGPIFAPATIESAAIDDSSRMVRDASGAEVVSSTTVAMPKGTEYIPAGSEVTLPPSHGGRTARVTAVQVADGGGLPTPDHLAINLE